MLPALARMQVSLRGLEQVLGCRPRLQAQERVSQASGCWLRAQVLTQPGQLRVPGRSSRLQAQVSEPVSPALERLPLEPARARLVQRKPALEPVPWLSLGSEQLQGLLAELALKPEL